jgi:uncharacterized membrane protein
VIFIILCNEPYLMAKLFHLEHSSINFKQVRSFISYVTQEEIFDQAKLLELARRCFYLALHSLV